MFIYIVLVFLIIFLNKYIKDKKKYVLVISLLLFIVLAARYDLLGLQCILLYSIATNINVFLKYLNLNDYNIKKNVARDFVKIIYEGVDKYEL